MSIDLGNNPVGSTPTDEQKTQLRSSIGLGSTDTVEFGELAASQLNFPNLTTSELNAVTDAAEGDTYFDSDRGQFIRFTGPSSYDVISTRMGIEDSLLPASSAISLPASRFLESGFITTSPDIFNTTSRITVFTDAEFSVSTANEYAYHDGQGFVISAGWFDVNNPFGGAVSSNVIEAGKAYRLETNDAGTINRTAFSFNTIVSSDITDNQLVSKALQGGSSYKIEVVAPICDLKEGNVRFDVGYDGVYTDATVQMKCDDLIEKQTLLQLRYKLSENDLFYFNNTSKLAVNSPKIGIYTFTLIINPSSDGVFTMSARQATSDVDPLLIDTVQTSISLLSS